MELRDLIAVLVGQRRYALVFQFAVAIRIATTQLSNAHNFQGKIISIFEHESNKGIFFQGQI